MILDLLGGRKVTFGLLIVAVGVAIEFFGPKGLTETMSTFLIGIGAGFFVGNGAEHIAGAMGIRGVMKDAEANSAPEPAPAVDLSGVQADLQTIGQALATQQDVLAYLAQATKRGEDLIKKSAAKNRQAIDGFTPEDAE